jgi:hypothetical protein
MWFDFVEGIEKEDGKFVREYWHLGEIHSMN